MNNFLTNKEKVSLYKQHKKERDGRVRDWIKAVLLRDRGWTWRYLGAAYYRTFNWNDLMRAISYSLK